MKKTLLFSVLTLLFAAFSASNALELSPPENANEKELVETEKTAVSLAADVPEAYLQSDYGTLIYYNGFEGDAYKVDTYLPNTWISSDNFYTAGILATRSINDTCTGASSCVLCDNAGNKYARFTSTGQFPSYAFWWYSDVGFDPAYMLTVVADVYLPSGAASRAIYCDINSTNTTGGDIRPASGNYLPSYDKWETMAFPATSDAYDHLRRINIRNNGAKSGDVWYIDNIRIYYSKSKEAVLEKYRESPYGDLIFFNSFDHHANGANLNAYDDAPADGNLYLGAPGSPYYDSTIYNRNYQSNNTAINPVAAGDNGYVKVAATGESAYYSIATWSEKTISENALLTVQMDVMVPSGTSTKSFIVRITNFKDGDREPYLANQTVTVDEYDQWQTITFRQTHADTKLGRINIRMNNGASGDVYYIDNMRVYYRLEAPTALSEYDYQLKSVGGNTAAGLRFKSTVSLGQYTDADEYGFIVTRKVLMDDLFPGESLTFDTVKDGRQYYVKGMAKSSAEGIDKQFAVDEDAVTYSAFVYNIKNTDETILARPYLKVGNMTFYGDTVEGCVDIVKSN